MSDRVVIDLEFQKLRQDNYLEDFAATASTFIEEVKAELHRRSSIGVDQTDVDVQAAATKRKQLLAVTEWYDQLCDSRHGVRWLDEYRGSLKSLMRWIPGPGAGFIVTWLNSLAEEVDTKFSKIDPGLAAKARQSVLNIKMLGILHHVRDHCIPIEVRSNQTDCGICTWKLMLVCLRAAAMQHSAGSSPWVIS